MPVPMRDASRAYPRGASGALRPAAGRLVVRASALAATFLLAAGCAGAGRQMEEGSVPSMRGTRGPEPSERAVLTARPAASGARGEPGLRRLPGPDGRDALLYVPKGYAPGSPAPLAVMLHGAGGTAQHGLDLLLAEADREGLILLAPQSRRQTWDVIGGEYGPDVAAIDAQLAVVFREYAVDPGRLAVGGFSDGASYALSVGVTNGDLFSHLIAFSPGFLAPGGQAGMPAIYISHGTRDEVLPIDRCSRRIVPQLERAGYAVRYREFDGPHTVPAEIRREALDWFRAAAATEGRVVAP